MKLTTEEREDQKIAEAEQKKDFYVFAIKITFLMVLIYAVIVGSHVGLDLLLRQGA